MKMLLLKMNMKRKMVKKEKDVEKKQHTSNLKKPMDGYVPIA